MAVWELIVEAVNSSHRRGHQWLTLGEVADAVLARHPGTNRGTITAETKFHCINDPSKKHSPGLVWLRDPLLVTDDPTMRGKRYRLLTDAERAAFLKNPRRDLELISYSRLMEWLNGTTEADIDEAIGEEDPPALDEPDVVADPSFAGTALLEAHLQDYMFRNWDTVFPGFKLYQGSAGREFVTHEPPVGVIDFLCQDDDGNFVVIETKRDTPDRQAIGQILGYMGWVRMQLCGPGQTVRGILLCGEVTDRLRMAAVTVPDLELVTYEISFTLRADAAT